MNIPKA